MGTRATHDVEMKTTAIRVHGLGRKVKAHFTYDRSDPYAVNVKFKEGGHIATWILARDLLRDGQTEERKYGDAAVRPSSRRRNEYLEVTWLPANGRPEMFDVPIRQLTDFLDHTYQLVPSGKESAMLDESLELAIQQFFNT